MILRGEIKEVMRRSINYLDNLQAKVQNVIETNGTREQVRTITIESCGLQRVLLNGVVGPLHTANVLALYDRMKLYGIPVQSAQSLALSAAYAATEDASMTAKSSAKAAKASAKAAKALAAMPPPKPPEPVIVVIPPLANSILPVNHPKPRRKAAPKPAARPAAAKAPPVKKAAAPTKPASRSTSTPASRTSKPNPKGKADLKATPVHLTPTTRK
jgi:hypothetical protein